MRLRLTIMAMMLAVAFAVGGPPSVRSQELNGAWSGALVREQSVQLIDIRLVETRDSLTGTYDIPELGLIDEPLTELQFNDSTLHLRILYGPFDLRHHADVDQLTGRNERWNPPVNLHLKKLAQPSPRSFRIEEVEFENGNVKLKGTLVLPDGDGPFPALVAVHGSGDQGRHVWEYRSHGYALAKRGVAVLLYDKRGTGESTGDYHTVGFKALADDARAGLNMLRRRRDIRAVSCGLLGISQGGWVVAIATARDANPSFVAFLEGPAVSVEQQEFDRVKYTMQAEGFDSSAVDSALAQTRRYFTYVNRRTGWDALKASSEAARASKWADYVNVATSPDDSDIAWWRRNAYDPARDLKNLACPVLAVFGELDNAVPPAENMSRMKRYLTAANIPYTIEVIDGMAHSVTTYHDLKGGDWTWPEHFWVWSRRPPDLDDVISGWVRKHTPR